VATPRQRVASRLKVTEANGLNVIETERLILRPLTVEDLEDVHAYQSLDEATRYVPFAARTLPQVLEALGRQKSAAELKQAGDFIIWGQVLKSTGRVIGQSNLGIENLDDLHAEFGYLLHPNYWGQGFATEASRAVLKYAFEVAKMRRVTAIIDHRNAASIRVAERLGMRREATFVDYTKLKGEWVTEHIFALLETEWQKQNPAGLAKS
jgi:RimJ/RimL family protein N-acetyltransferase